MVEITNVDFRDKWVVFTLSEGLEGLPNKKKVRELIQQKTGVKSVNLDHSKQIMIGYKNFKNVKRIKAPWESAWGFALDLKIRINKILKEL